MSSVKFIFNRDVNMSDSGLLSVGEVNELQLDQFQWLFGNIVEKTPEAANYVYNDKPFKDAGHIVALFHKYLDTRSDEEQQSILRLYPDLGTKFKMTEESVKEQEFAGLTRLNDKDHEILMEYNNRYQEKFGFPFVICARDNTSESMLQMIRIRVHKDKQIELRTGVEEIKKIGRYRVHDLVWHD